MRADLIDALNLDDHLVRDVGVYRDYLVVVDCEETVRTLSPDFAKLKTFDKFVCVSAPTADGQFCSRFFTPADGIDEDPVTGSAHCMLVPYWAKKLGKADFVARQLSERGGILFCKDLGDRVEVSGQAVTFMRGDITVP